ncbi:MAG TPA: oligosaccharide flippase family protein, partial [Acetobacteraceae bacterium]|nr:oligosaccharide flippase family protein [Acetobacteraceae bacterium]
VQAGIGGPLAAWLADPRLHRMCLLLAVPLPLVGAAGVMQGVLTTRRRYRTLAWRTLAGQGLGTLAGIGAAGLHAGAWAPVLQQFVVSTIGALALLIGAGVRPHASLHWPVVRGLLRVGLPLTVSTLVLAARYRLFAVLIGGTAGAAALGQVHMAFRLVETVRELAFTAQWRLMLPILSEQRQDRPALRAGCDRLLGLSNLVMLPLCGALALTLPELVRTLLGPGWRAAGWATEPLIALMALLTLTFPSSIALVARGETTRSLIGSLLSTAAVLGGAAVLRPSAPLQATLLWFGAHLLALPYTLRMNGRALGTGPLRPLRAGGPMLAVVLLGVALGALLPGAVRGGAASLWTGLARLALFAALVVPAVAMQALPASASARVAGLRRR